MKNIFSGRLMAAGASLVVTCSLVGCGQKASTNAELEKAASVMQKEERATAPAPAVTLSTAPSQAAQPAATAPVSSAAWEMNQAMASYKAGNIEDAVSRLQRLRAASAVTPQQRMALNDAMAAVMTDVAAQAAKGDPRAIQALKQYQQMQMQRQ